MRRINLDDILTGFPGLSTFKAGMLLESCVVTLARLHHSSGVIIELSGDSCELLCLEWSMKADDQLEKTYADQQEATEHAAECLAILLSRELKGLTTLERSIKKTGVDYWMGKEGDPLFQRKARLEVSGIYNGGVSKLERRFREKSRQTNQSDHTGLPAIISVTCFKVPLTKFANK